MVIWDTGHHQCKYILNFVLIPKYQTDQNIQSAGVQHCAHITIGIIAPMTGWHMTADNKLGKYITIQQVNVTFYLHPWRLMGGNMWLPGSVQVTKLLVLTILPAMCCMQQYNNNPFHVNQLGETWN